MPGGRLGQPAIQAWRRVGDSNPFQIAREHVQAVQCLPQLIGQHQRAFEEQRAGAGDLEHAEPDGPSDAQQLP